jgi:arylsulfatase A-like enzyme
MQISRRLLTSLFWGALAGLGALALEQLASLFTLGLPVPLGLTDFLCYLGPMMLLALVIELCLLAARRPCLGPAQSIALPVALLFAATVSERSCFLLTVLTSQPQNWVLILVAVLLGLGSTAGFVLLLRWLLTSVAGANAWALTLASASIALGLACNRHLFDQPLAPIALAGDAGILLGVVLVALLLRWAGTQKVLLGAAGLAGLVLLVMTSRHLWLAPPAASLDAPNSTRPDLLLVVVDTLRQDVFEQVLAGTAEGKNFASALGPAISFTQARASAPWTAPSVASILTGLYPAEHGYAHDPTPVPLSWRLPAEITPLAAKLDTAGYHTTALITNPVIHPLTGIGRGFTTLEYLESSVGMLGWLTVLQWVGLAEHGVYQPAAVVCHRARRQLGAARGQPIFLWLHLMDPHGPLHAHPELFDEPANQALTPLQQRYFSEVRYTLLHLTRLIEFCQEQGIWDNLVFVLTSDHGESFATDGHQLPSQPECELTGHGQALYDEQLRVPLIIRPAGGLTAPRQVKSLVSLTDLSPTLLELAGIPPNHRLTLTPWLNALTPATQHRAVLSTSTTTLAQEAISTSANKLIHYLDGTRPDELYDLLADPCEHHNLANEAPNKKRELRQILEAAKAQLGPTPKGTAPPSAIDEKTRRSLEALGYL